MEQLESIIVEVVELINSMKVIHSSALLALDKSEKFPSENMYVDYLRASENDEWNWQNMFRLADKFDTC